MRIKRNRTYSVWYVENVCDPHGPYCELRLARYADGVAVLVELERARVVNLHDSIPGVIDEREAVVERVGGIQEA